MDKTHHKERPACCLFQCAIYSIAYILALNFVTLISQVVVKEPYVENKTFKIYPILHSFTSDQLLSAN